MCGSDTLTTVVSSTSMKVANITEMAMIHGIDVACSSRCVGHRSRPMTLISYTPSASPTCPGRSRCSGSWPGSSTIFTGTRCTTFTKLPVAFSGGSRLKRAPVAAAMLSTLPLNSRAAVGVDRDRRALARPHVRSAASP